MHRHNNKEALMKRLLTNAVIFAGGLMASSQLLALGLGELTLDSTLSQPLKAEVHLVDTKGLTEWDIKPSLASQEDFDRAGVERVFFLTKIDFKVDGDRILLTTRESINEPFLNFLIELNWPSGRVLREYTVLLDPPTYDEENYQPLVVTPETDVTETELVVATPEQPVMVNKWNEPAEPGTYKVQTNDTLWAIALKNRPSGDITPQQMMLALQQENPHAFINGNINRLKSHQVLRIPNEQQIRSIGISGAIAEVARQNRAVSSATAQIDATGRTSSFDGEQTSQGGEVRLIADKTEDGEAASAAGEVGQGSDVTREALENDLAIALENADRNQRDNQELNERLESLEDQIETLQRLISLKDDQLAELQAGGLDTDTASATEETTADQDFNFSEEGEPKTFAVEEQQEIVAEDAEALAAEQEAKEAARRERLAAILAEQAQQQEDEKTIVDQLLENPMLPAGGAAVLLLIALLVMRALKKRKAPESSDDDPDPSDDAMLRDLELNEGSLDDFDFADDVDDQSFMQDLDDSEDVTASAKDESFDGVAQTEDVITESDIYIAFGNFDQAAQLLQNAIKEDPQRSELYLKLLEVYVELDDAQQFANTEAQLQPLANNEAIEEAARLRQRLSSPIEPALGQETGSNELNSDSTDRFIDTEVEATANASDELDVDLTEEFNDGLDFADALDMSAGEPASAVDINANADVETDEVPTLDLEDEFSNEIEFGASDVTEDAKEEDNEISFDFGDEASFEEPELDIPELEVSDLESEDTDKEDDNSLDFDMSFDTAEDKPAQAPELEVPELDTAEKDDQNEVEALDFDVSETSQTDGLDSLEDILDGEGSSAADDSDFSFDLEGLSDETDGSRDANETALASNDLPEFSDDELEFDLGGDTASEPTPASEAEANQPAPTGSDDIDLDQLAAAENEFDFLAGTDECATKLDLARAYIDMEDADGAKELLQEVIDEGSDQQKTEARELLANLA